MGSYSNWTAEFANSRCSRTVNNSYNASIQSTTGCWKSASTGDWWFTSYQTCSNNGCNAGGNIYNIGDRLTFPARTCAVYSYTYYCPNGGTLGSTTCTKIDTEYKAFSSF